MKILLTMNLPYTRVHGGANRSNRSLVEGLAARGHVIRVVVPALATPSHLTHEQLLRELADEGYEVRSQGGTDVFRVNEVEVHAVVEPERLRGYLVEQLRSFEPDWVLVSSEDQSQSLLAAALKTCPTKVVYLAHTPQMFPFGPYSLYPGAARTELVGQAAAIVTISKFVAGYIKECTGFDTFINHPPHFGAGPFPFRADFDQGYVLLMNASAIKGITIFLELARTLPHVEFAALTGYGTTASDRAALNELSNVTLLKNQKHLDDILRQTRILLMPSLWVEGFGMAATDAMLRGIPVLASNFGGLVEAKLGTDYLLPVNPITRFGDELDDNLLPTPVVPPQDVAPWREALTSLLSQRELYERQARSASTAAHQFVSQLSVAPFEELLLRLGKQKPSEPARAKAQTNVAAYGTATLTNARTGNVADLTPEQKALLILRLRKKNAESATSKKVAPPIVPIRRDQPLPLSFAQQRLWFIDQMEPNAFHYNLPAVVRLRGTLHVPALERCLSEIQRRHEVLRTHFAIAGNQPVQVITPPQPLTLPVTNLSHLSTDEREAEARRLAQEEAELPFDLSTGPLLRVGLLRLGEQEHVCLLTLHHIVSDGWSVGVLIKEVAALYEAYARGEQSPLTELAIQYADFAVWQREWLQGEVLEEHLNYWREQLKGAPPLLELPTDRPRLPVASYHGATHSFIVPAELATALRTLSQREGVTLYMTLLAAFQLLLARHSGQPEIIVGTPIAGRGRIETEPLIGFFVNTLVLRTDLSGEPTIIDLLRRVREVCLGAYAHQDLPFEMLVEQLQPQRSLSYSPLFQVFFVLQNVPVEELKLAGLTLTPVANRNEVAKFDLVLDLREMGEFISGTLEYNSDLFDSATVERLASHFLMLLRSIVDHPLLPVARLSLLPPHERELVLSRWNNTPAPFPRDLCLHHLFERQAALSPDAPAIVAGETLTYAEVNERANRLAHYLRTLGATPDTPIALCLERGADQLVAVLGVLKAGGAYLPLDPQYPSPRLTAMLIDAGARLLVTMRTLLPESLREAAESVVLLDADAALIAAQPISAPEVQVVASNLAYVIYTSGSTGKPKGVGVEHRAVVSHNYALRDLYELGPGDRVLQFASLSFDVAVEEIFPTWLSGGAVVVRSDESPGSARSFFGELAAQGVTVVNLPTAFWQQMVSGAEEEPEVLRGLRLRVAAIGGEAGQAEGFAQAQRVMGEGVRIWNVYGPTETTVTNTACEYGAKADGQGQSEAQVEAAAEGARGGVPLGKAIGNSEVYVLDAWMQPVPVGVWGELYIGGEGVARGYLNRPHLTAERFVPHPFSREAGARLYRTGDVVRYLGTGELEFGGRTDTQVKVRGYRVELGEVEAALSGHAGVRECVVVVRADAGGDKRLVAYVVAEAEQRQGAGETGAGEWRRYLKERLPEHMIPSVFVELEEIPLTPNGKVDRRALPEPEAGGAGAGVEYVAPRTVTEEMVSGMWAEVLGVERVGVNDDFFELGGHSLLATQVISRVRAAFGVEVALRELFEGPTVAELSHSIEAAMRERQVVAPPIVPVSRDQPLPLSFAQQRLWFLDQLEPGNAFYNSPGAVRLLGELNIEALERTLSEVVERHEVLRTHFAAVDGQPVQLISPARSIKLPVLDLGHLPEAEREAAVIRLADEEAKNPFTLSTGPLFRASLIKLSEREHVVLLTLHHIVSDGWSFGIMVREVATLYTAFVNDEASPLEKLPIQYADYAYWQRRWLSGEAMEQLATYWRNRLRGQLPVLQLPSDRPRPAVQTFRGDRKSFALPKDITDAVQELSLREGCTTYMTLLAAFLVLLQRYTRQEDILIGSAIANRNRRETENLIGFFINMVVLRADLSGDPSFETLLKQVREVALGAYAHQDMPLEKLVEEFAPERNTNHSPLFQVAFGVQNAPASELQLPGLKLYPVELEAQVVRFDLTLWMVEEGDSLTGKWTYSTDMFDEATISRMAQHFETLLGSIVAQPETRLSALEMLTEEEKRQQEISRREREAANANKLKRARRKTISNSSLPGAEVARSEELPTLSERSS